MTATIKDMDYVHVDNLTPTQLEIDDLIEIGDEVVKIKNISDDSTGDNYFITIENEFGEEDVVELKFDSFVKLFMFL